MMSAKRKWNIILARQHKIQFFLSSFRFRYFYISQWSWKFLWEYFWGDHPRKHLCHKLRWLDFEHLQGFCQSNAIFWRKCWGICTGRSQVFLLSNTHGALKYHQGKVWLWLLQIVDIVAKSTNCIWCPVWAHVLGWFKKNEICNSSWNNLPTYMVLKFHSLPP